MCLTGFAPGLWAWRQDCSFGARTPKLSREGLGECMTLNRAGTTVGDRGGTWDLLSLGDS